MRKCQRGVAGPLDPSGWGPRLGLELNLGKCELVVFSPETPPHFTELFPPKLLIDADTGKSRVMKDGCFEFLGAFIGSASFCANGVRSRIQKAVGTLKSAAQVPDPQIALRLVRRCQGFCKLVYCIRTIPSQFIVEELATFDSDMRSAFVGLSGINVSEGQWDQAGRGFWVGGLGLRHTARHAAAAYVASCTATRKLCLQLDTGFQWGGDSPSCPLAQSIAALNAELPPG